MEWGWRIPARGTAREMDGVMSHDGGDSMPLSSLGYEAGHWRWGWSSKEDFSSIGCYYPSQVVASVTTFAGPHPPSFHLTSFQQAHHTLLEEAASSHSPSCGMNDSPSAPEVGSDWLKPSAYPILLVRDWFRAGHMTQLRPTRGEMFAGVSGERIARSPLGELAEGTRAFLLAPGSEGHEGPGVKATLEERMSERWSLAGPSLVR